MSDIIRCGTEKERSLCLVLRVTSIYYLDKQEVSRISLGKWPAEKPLSRGAGEGRELGCTGSSKPLLFAIIVIAFLDFPTCSSYHIYHKKPVGLLSQVRVRL